MGVGSLATHLWVVAFLEADASVKWMPAQEWVPWQSKLESGTRITKRKASCQSSHCNHSGVCGDTGANKPIALPVEQKCSTCNSSHGLCHLGFCKGTLWCSHTNKCTYWHISHNTFPRLSSMWHSCHLQHIAPEISYEGLLKPGAWKRKMVWKMATGKNLWPRIRVHT